MLTFIVHLLLINSVYKPQRLSVCLSPFKPGFRVLGIRTFHPKKKMMQILFWI